MTEARTEAQQLLDYALQNSSEKTQTEVLYRRRGSINNINQITVTRWFRIGKNVRLVLGFDKNENFAWANYYDAVNNKWGLGLTFNRAQCADDVVAHVVSHLASLV